MEKIKIIFSPTNNKPYYIIDKPSGLPTAPLSADDKNNLVHLLSDIHPEILQVKGKKEIEHGLIHRLDTVTSGLVIVAANQQCYEDLCNLQKDNKITKSYSAVCKFSSGNFEGFPDNPVIETIKKAIFNKECISFTVSSYFRYFGLHNSQVRPVTENSGKAALKKIGKPVLYSTKISIQKYENDFIYVLCRITNGFKHQVRCHLAWCGLPIQGDSIYSEEDKKNAENKIMFSATNISFEYPRGDLNSYDRKDTWT